MKRKLWIEILWSVMGGLLFSLLTMYKKSGSFDITRILENELLFGIGYCGCIDEFIFGFIFTYILVKSIRKYKETN